MAVTANCTSVVLEASRVRIRFADGCELEFPNKQSVQDYIATLDTDPEQARKWLLARWAHNNPTLANPGNIQGHSCTIDLAATPVISFV